VRSHSYLYAFCLLLPLGSEYWWRQ